MKVFRGYRNLEGVLDTIKYFCPTNLNKILHFNDLTSQYLNLNLGLNVFPTFNITILKIDKKTKQMIGNYELLSTPS